MFPNNLPLPAWLTSAQTIAIVGFGREGKSTAKFLQKHLPYIRTIVFDTHQTEFEIPAVDVIFKSPGIPLRHVHYKGYPYITSQTDLFTQMYGGQIIAVTGTKGKSTTSHVIAHVFATLGKDTLVLGNIGRPALDYVDQIDANTTIVFEMSSFQTESLHVAPHIGVFTSLYQDHLDYYESFAAYSQAKKHLFDLQTEQDICLYRNDDMAVESLVQDTKGKKYGYSASQVEHSVAWIENDDLVYENEVVANKAELLIKGTQNIVNMLPSIVLSSVVLKSQVPQIAKALRTVEGLPGRLELVATKNDIEFYDDALATIPEATIAGIESLGDSLQTLIVGGFDRSQDFTKLATIIANSSITTLVTFPTTGQKIADQVCLLNPKLHCIPVRSMIEAVHACFEYTDKGRAVLLSTASPSFGLFDDYRDRSAQYKQCIQNF